jgi:tetratricopeptide (TPR) repeat protein
VVAPAGALYGFLAALQVPPARIPAGLDARVALYRGRLAGKRVLVVLDNARDAGQVRPLLPGGSGCFVVITSRDRLAGLVAEEGAHPITLDLLAEGEAWQLLAHRLGADRVAAEPEAVGEIIARCARLPLALAIVAARAAGDERLPLAVYAVELGRARGDLGPFTGEDPRTDVRAVFSWSYRALSVEAARLFRLLGLHPGPDLAVPAAASLAGISEQRVRRLLAELTGAHLVAEATPGRYAFHDLLRGYAAEQAHAVDNDHARRAALHRVLDHYLHTAYTASLQLHPHRAPITLTPPQAGAARTVLAGYDEALAWLAAEHPVLLASITQATHHGFDVHAWQLTAALVPFFQARGHWHDWITTHTCALAATVRLADRPGQARTHRSAAYAHARLGHHADAATHLRHALRLSRALHDRTGEGHTRLTLSTALGQQGRHRQALHHAQAALDLFQTADHRAGQARALNAIGWYHGQLGDHQQALTHCQQGLAIAQQLGARHDQAATWDSLGHAHRHLGHHHQAVTCYQHAADLSHQLGDQPQQAEVLTHLGDTHHAAGNHTAAHNAWQQALTILDELDDPEADAVRAKLAG